MCTGKVIPQGIEIRNRNTLFLLLTNDLYGIPEFQSCAKNPRNIYQGLNTICKTFLREEAKYALSSSLLHNRLLVNSSNLFMPLQTAMLRLKVDDRMKHSLF